MSSPSRSLSHKLKLVGQRGQTYVLRAPLARRRDKPCNVWSAAAENDETDQYVIKQPNDDDGSDWSSFMKEMQMQEFFRNSNYLRRMVDVIPQLPDSDPPTLVLEPFQKSLWNARMQRPLSTGEIRSVMKSILLGLGTIHNQKLVYTDLKMENILVRGFNDETPDSGDDLVTKIADLELIQSPSGGEISSITYRSPEVYFRRPWTASTDIWSWGVVYCHLLEAQVEFDKPGMFDSIVKGTLTEKAEAVRAAIAQEFDLHSLDYYTSEASSRELLPPKDETRQELDHWAVKLLSKRCP